MIGRMAPVAAGLAWGLVVFWIALVLSFPSEVVQERISWEVNRATHGSLALRLESVRPSWGVTGARFEGVQLLSVDKTSDEDEPGLASLIFSASRVATRVRVLPLLGGDVLAELDADLYQGTLLGELGKLGDLFLADIIAKDLDLSLYPFEGEDWSADVSGLLDLVVDMKVNPEEVKEAKGDISLEVDGLTLRALSLSGFTIDEAIFDEAILKLDVHNGEAEIRKGSFLSDMVEATLDGKITLSSPLERSRLKLTMKIRLEEDLDTLAQLAPGMKNARDDGGTYHFMISGSIERPRIREDRMAARKRKSNAPDPVRRDDRDDRALVRPPSRKVEGEEDADAEERRRLREERISDRRERMRENRDQQIEGERSPGPDRQRGDPPPDFEEDLRFNDQRMDDEDFPDDDLPDDEMPPDDELDYDEGEVRDLGYAD